MTLPRKRDAARISEADMAPEIDAVIAEGFATTDVILFAYERELDMADFDPGPLLDPDLFPMGKLLDHDLFGVDFELDPLFNFDAEPVFDLGDNPFGLDIGDIGADLDDMGAAPP